MVRTHSGGLFCHEGSTHLSRPSTRIKNPPGGASSWNFLDHEEVKKPVKKQENVPETKLEVRKRSKFFKPAPKLTEKITGSPVKRLERNNENISPKVNRQTLFAEHPTFCSEGSQIRGRPCVKIIGERRRDYNIIAGN